MLRLALVFLVTGGVSGLLSLLVLIVGVGMTGPTIAAGERAVMWIGGVQALIWLASAAANAVLAALGDAPLWAKLASAVLYLLLAVAAFLTLGFLMLVLLNR